MIKGQVVSLRDADYTLSAIPLGVVKDIWPQVQKVVGYNGGNTDAMSTLPDVLDAAADVVLASMKGGNYPEMTKERLVGQVLDYGNWKEAFYAALAISNIKLQKAEPGNDLALATMGRTLTASSSISPVPSAGPSTTSEAA